MQDLFYKIFSHLCPTSAAATHEQLVDLGVPSLGQLHPGQSYRPSNFGSNVTVTTSKGDRGFANRAHCDNDASYRIREEARKRHGDTRELDETEKGDATEDEIAAARDGQVYTIGVFFAVRRSTGELIDDGEILQSKFIGGDFHVTGFEFKISFAKCPFTVIIWRGPIDRHGTVRWQVRSCRVA